MESKADQSAPLTSDVNVFPGLSTSGDRTPLLVESVPPSPYWGFIPRDWVVSWSSFLVGLLGIFLSMYVGWQTNIRSRNDTFQSLRERFESVESPPTA